MFFLIPSVFPFYQFGAALFNRNKWKPQMQDTYVLSNFLVVIFKKKTGEVNFMIFYLTQTKCCQHSNLKTIDIFYILSFKLSLWNIDSICTGHILSSCSHIWLSGCCIWPCRSRQARMNRFNQQWRIKK